MKDGLWRKLDAWLLGEISFGNCSSYLFSKFIKIISYFLSFKKWIKNVNYLHFYLLSSIRKESSLRGKGYIIC